MDRRSFIFSQISGELIAYKSISLVQKRTLKFPDKRDLVIKYDNMYDVIDDLIVELEESSEDKE